jgi:eukaryotic-like serine/threonine-protein kinase
MTAGHWQKIERIYQAAVERPAAERPSFLDAACAGDGELRAEVERMLACESQAGGFLDSPAVAVAARALAGDRSGLSPGSRLGPYEIVSLAGVGGMGEVWKARDTRLGRLVALKTLPPELIADPERRHRLVHEARAASSLNRPNIVTIYEIGQTDGIDFIAMEFVEGQTLEKKVRQRRLKQADALRLAIQIADALAQAHQAGIVHRDLKPGNVMVTAGGAVKLLDFGLAKQSGNPGGHGAAATATATRPGVVLGTPQYMAPEQIEGKPADHRTDIFAFGLVLYEMLTGKKAFEADSGPSLMAAILTGEPPAVAGVPPALERLVKKCLAKEPGQRWQSAADLRDNLEWIASGEPSAAPPAPPRRLRTAAATAALCLLFALAGWIGAEWIAPRSTPQVYEFSVPPPRGELYPELRAGGQISPNERIIATISRTRDRQTSVWLRRFDSGSLTPLAGTEGVGSIAWSPDSSQLAFSKSGKIVRVPIEGGIAQTLFEASDALRGDWPIAWGSGGYLLTTDPTTKRLLLIPEKGGQSRLLGELDSSRGEISHSQPQFLPDGRRYLYFARSSNPQNSGIYADSIDAGSGRSTPIHVLASRSAAILAPRSEGRLIRRWRAYLLTHRDGTLFANRFHLGKLRVEGQPMPVASQVTWEDSAAGVSVSRNGALALDPLIREETEAAIFSTEGKELEHPFPEGRYWVGGYSNDGNKIAVGRTKPVGTQQETWICDLPKSSWSRFAFSTRWQGFPVWRHDDRELVYATVVDSGPEMRLLYRRDADGIREPQKILGPARFPSPYDWSRDGRYLIYALYRATRPAGFDLWILPMDGSGNPYAFLESEHNARFGSFSPDTRFVTFSWNPAGQEEVYVRPFDRAKARQWRISAGGGTQPRWSRDGRHIYFLGAGNKLMRTAVSIRGEFMAAAPVPLMPMPRLPWAFSGYLYDVSPRGDRVLLTRINPHVGTPSVRVILNWEGLLKQ